MKKYIYISSSDPLYQKSKLDSANWRINTIYDDFPSIVKKITGTIFDGEG